ncbi:hypothetical protein MCEMSEM23_02676 [Rhabdaerophilaceae bacterium]
MTNLKKSFAIALTALSLGSAALLTASSAEAGPRGGGARFHGGHGHHGFGHRHWGHRHWGVRPVYRPIVRVGYGYGGGCRLVQRVNRFGEIVVRRVCYARTVY